MYYFLLKFEVIHPERRLTSGNMSAAVLKAEAKAKVNDEQVFNEKQRPGSDFRSYNEGEGISFVTIRGERVPIAFLSARQRRKHGVKSVMDIADALKINTDVNKIKSVAKAKGPPNKQYAMHRSSDPSHLPSALLQAPVSSTQNVQAQALDLSEKQVGDQRFKKETNINNDGDDCDELGALPLSQLELYIESVTWPYTLVLCIYLWSVVPAVRAALLVLECDPFGGGDTLLLQKSILQNTCNLNEALNVSSDTGCSDTSLLQLIGNSDDTIDQFDVAEGRTLSWLVADPSVQCWTDYHWRWVALAVAVILFYSVVAPSILLSLLWKYTAPPLTQQQRARKAEVKRDLAKSNFKKLMEQKQKKRQVLNARNTSPNRNNLRQLKDNAEAKQLNDLPIKDNSNKKLSRNVIRKSETDLDSMVFSKEAMDKVVADSLGLHDMIMSNNVLRRFKRNLLLKQGAQAFASESTLDMKILRVYDAHQRRKWQKRLWLLFDGYRSQCFYFEIVDIIFQLICYGALGLPSYLASCAYVSLQFKGFAALGYALTIMWIQPYKDLHLNTAKQVSLLSLFAIFECGVFGSWVSTQVAESTKVNFDSNFTAVLASIVDPWWNFSESLFDVQSGGAAGTNFGNTIPAFYSTLQALEDLSSTSSISLHSFFQATVLIPYLYVAECFIWAMFLVGLVAVAGSVTVIGPLKRCFEEYRKRKSGRGNLRGDVTMSGQVTHQMIDAITLTHSNSKDRLNFEIERDWNHLSSRKNATLKKIIKLMEQQYSEATQQIQVSIAQEEERIRVDTRLEQQKHKEQHIQSQLIALKAKQKRD